MARPKNKSGRLVVYTILHKFYSESFYSKVDDREISLDEIILMYPALINPYEIYMNFDIIDIQKYCCEVNNQLTGDVFDIRKLNPILDKILREHSSEFSNIELMYDIHDNFIDKYCIVGSRLENNFEYEQRMEKLRQMEDAEFNEKLRKNELRQQKRIEAARKILQESGQL